MMAITFSEVYDRWFESRRIDLRPSSCCFYNTVWFHCLKPLIGDATVTGFGRAEARGLMTTLLSSGLSVKTVRDRMALVKQLITWTSTEYDLPVKSTGWGLRYPEAKVRARKSFTGREVDRIIKAGYDEICRGTRRSVPALIALLTGMRIGEICGLRWDDIDLRRKVLTVRRTVSRVYDITSRSTLVLDGAPKTRAGYREVPLCPALMDILRDAYGPLSRCDGYVVGKGHPADPRNVREAFTRFLRHHGLPSVNFHGLRHTFATRLVESRADLKTVSSILGHADVAMTMNLYVHPSSDARTAAVRKAYGSLNLSMKGGVA